jgi:hypothetical protein
MVHPVTGLNCAGCEALIRLLIRTDGQVELQAPVRPLECADNANFHKHDEVRSVDHDLKARVEELCAVGVKPKQIMQQQLEDGAWGTLSGRPSRGHDAHH